MHPHSRGGVKLRPHAGELWTDGCLYLRSSFLFIICDDEIRFELMDSNPAFSCEGPDDPSSAQRFQFDLN